MNPLQHNLLKIVQREAISDEEQEPAEKQSQLVIAVRNFTKKIADNSTTLHEQHEVLPYFTRCAARILIFFRNSPNSQSLDCKRQIMDLLSEIQRVYHTLNSRREHNMHYDGDRLLLIREIVSLSTSLQLHLENVLAESSPLKALEEELVGSLLGVFSAIFQMLGNDTAEFVTLYLDEAKSLWSAMIYALVRIVTEVRYNSNALQSVAIDTLMNSMQLMKFSFKTLKPIVPGVIGVLHQVCLSPKRSCRNIYKAFSIMLEIISIVCNDNAAQNQQLLNYVSDQNSSVSTSRGIDATPSNHTSNLLYKLVEKVKASTGIAIPSVAEQTHDTDLESNNDMEISSVYRVQFVQRLAKSFPRAFECICRVLIRENKEVTLHYKVFDKVFVVLSNCSAYLGTTVFQSILVGLLRYLDPLDYLNYALHVDKIRHIISSLHNKYSGVEIEKALANTLIDSIRQLVERNLEDEEELALLRLACNLLSVFTASSIFTSSILVTQTTLIKKLLVKLFSVDLQHSSKYLASSNALYYTFDKRSSVQTNCYSLLPLYTNNSTNKYRLPLSRLLCVDIAISVIFSSLVEDYTQCLNTVIDIFTLSDSTSNNNITSNNSSKKLEYYVNKTIAHVNIITNMLYGYLKYTITKSNDNDHNPDVWCVYCQVKKGVMRCSGCRKAVYCNAEHQKLHWKEHKSQCSSLSEDKKEDGSTKNISAVEKEYFLGVDPDEVLKSNHITIKTGSFSDISDIVDRVEQLYNLWTDSLEKLIIILPVTKTPDISSSKSKTSRYLEYCILVLMERLADTSYLYFYCHDSCASKVGSKNRSETRVENIMLWLHLLVREEYKLVKASALSSMMRIISYTKYSSLAHLLRCHLDYIVDKVCLQIKTNLLYPFYNAINTYDNTSSKILVLVIEYVFQTAQIVIQDFSFPKSTVATNNIVSNTTDTLPFSALQSPISLFEDIIDAYIVHMDNDLTSNRNGSTFGVCYITNLMVLLKVTSAFVHTIPIDISNGNKINADQSTICLKNALLSSLVDFNSNLHSLKSSCMNEDNVNHKDIMAIIDNGDDKSLDEYSTSKYPHYLPILLPLLPRLLYLLSLPHPMLHNSLYSLFSRILPRLKASSFQDLNTSIYSICAELVSKLNHYITIFTGNKISSADGNHRLLHSFPNLLDLFSLLYSLSPSFVSNKLVEDVFPQINSLLYFIFTHRNNASSDSSVRDKVTTLLVESIFRFLLCILGVEDSSGVFHSKSLMKVWLWLSLSILIHNEDKEVEKVIGNLISKLVDMNPIYWKYIKNAMLSLDADKDEEGKLALTTLLSHPHLYQSYTHYLKQFQKNLSHNSSRQMVNAFEHYINSICNGIKSSGRHFMKMIREMSKEGNANYQNNDGNDTELLEVHTAVNYGLAKRLMARARI